MENKKIILVIGATGRQGGAVAKHLLEAGRVVKALTRDSNSVKALALKKAGAVVVEGNLDEPENIQHFFEGVYGVFSVQNPWITGLEKEIKHGKVVADLAKQFGIKHFVYTSAGYGKAGTDVPHFESKLQVEHHIKHLQLPYTILRPAGFMEMMSDKSFAPPLVAWNVTGKMLGDDFPLSWIAVDDIGAAAAKIFSEPDKHIGKELELTGDIKSMKECREIYRNVCGKNPFRIPAPVWLFRLMQKDLCKMYNWMKEQKVPERSLADTKQMLGKTMTVEIWMKSLNSGII